MSNLINARTTNFLLVFICFLSASCESLHYGFLPGEDYPVYKNSLVIDLKGQTFEIDLRDSRDQNRKVNCIAYSPDRNTDLEGETGLNLTQNYLKRSIESANGKIVDHGHRVIIVSLDVISFDVSGFLQVTVEGVAQLTINSSFGPKTYCRRISDKDPGAPLKWNSFDSRRGASRKMASAALRLVVDDLLSDLVKSDFILAPDQK